MMTITALAQDSGWMGDRKRGASLGRADSGALAAQLDYARDDLRTVESTLQSAKEGFEPGWYDRDESGHLQFTPNFPTPESRAEWIAGLEQKAAAMRAEIAALESSAGDAQRFYLQRVRLDSGGYDSGGAYWGIGSPLYRFESADGCLSGFLRARTREQAKAGVRDEHPRAEFFN